MKIITTCQLEHTPREVFCPRGGFVSYRFLLQSDGMGFGLHRTVIPAGGPQRWWYPHHLEACYCVSGKGDLLNELTGERYAIAPGTCYVLNMHEPHVFTAIQDTVLICAFNPPLIGTETHGPDGSYPSS